MTTTPIETVEITEVAQAVTLSPTAAGKLSQILQEKNLPDHGLRLSLALFGPAIWHGLRRRSADMDTIVDHMV
jgi:hypothetical protein